MCVCGGGESWIRRTVARKTSSECDVYFPEQVLKNLKYIPQIYSTPLSRHSLFSFCFLVVKEKENKLSLAEWSNVERKSSQGKENTNYSAANLWELGSFQTTEQIDLRTWGRGWWGWAERAAKIQAREVGSNCPLALWQWFNHAEPRASLYPFHCVCSLGELAPGSCTLFAQLGMKKTHPQTELWIPSASLETICWHREMFWVKGHALAGQRRNFRLSIRIFVEKTKSIDEGASTSKVIWVSPASHSSCQWQVGAWIVFPRSHGRSNDSPAGFLL